MAGFTCDLCGRYIGIKGDGMALEADLSAGGLGLLFLGQKHFCCPAHKKIYEREIGSTDGLAAKAVKGSAKLAFKGAVGLVGGAINLAGKGVEYVNQKAAEAQAEAERQAAIAAEVAKEQGRAAFEALKAKRTNRSTKAQAAEFLFCAECGTKLEAGSAFCDECGNRL